jgi:hypothetical protein
VFALYAGAGPYVVWEQATGTGDLVVWAFPALGAVLGPAAAGVLGGTIARLWVTPAPEERARR